MALKDGELPADMTGMDTLPTTTDPQQTLDVAIGWAHQQGDYTAREFADGSAYRCELEMMADSWGAEYPNTAGALALLDAQGRLDTTGLTDAQVSLLMSHKGDSLQLRQMMAARLLKINRQQLGLPTDASSQQIADALENA